MHPEFQALSYTWGNPFPASNDSSGVQDWDSLTQEIRCNGLPVFIAQNLYDLLCQLYSMAHTGFIWADLLCIDQTNLEERSSQVSLMGDIFVSASQVICWLGRRDEHTNSFFELHEILAPALRAHVNDQDIDKATKYDIEHPSLLHELRLVRQPPLELGMPVPSLEHWKSYGFFTTRSWFKRLWIVQEVGLARHARMLCGDQEVSWTDIELIAEFVVKSRGRNDFLAIHDLLVGDKWPTMDIIQLCRVRQFRLFNPPALRPSTADYFFRVYGATTKKQVECAFLLDMWARVLLKEKTDLRDDIYALLGLVSRSLRGRDSLFQADYRLSIEQVLTRTTTALIANIPALSSFYIVGDPSSRRIHGLPSWVPDPTALDYLDLESVQMGYAAGMSPYKIFPPGTYPWQPDFASRIVTDRCLTLSGTFIGRLVERSLTYESRSTDVYEQFQSMWRSALSLPEKYPFTQQDRGEVFWRTLIGFLDDTNPQELQDAGHKFVAWLVFWLRYIVVSQRKNKCINDHLEEGLCFIREIVKSSMRDDMVPSTDEMEDFVETRTPDVTSKWRRIVAAARQFRQILTLSKRRICRTSNDLLVKGPTSAETNDEIWIIRDSRIPFLLRPILGSENYQFVGPAYVHGIMFGAVMKENPAFKPVTLE